MGDNTMKIRISRTGVIQVALIYLCFLNTSSRALSMLGKGLTIATFAICLLCLVTKRVKMSDKFFGFIAAFFAVLLFQHTIIQQNISIVSLANLLTQFLIAYCAVKIDTASFIKRFVGVTVFLATASLIFFAISLTPASVVLTKMLLPNDAHNWTNRVSYGRFLYHYMIGYPRNVGIFREPGVFQLFLNLSLFLTLFFPHFFTQREKNRYAIILLLTIITAASTAGYLTAIIILCGYVINNRKKLSSRNVLMLLGCLLAAAIFTQTELFEKVFLAKMAFSNGSFETGTGNARLASVLIDLKYISNNIWGYGFNAEWNNALTNINTQEVGSSCGLSAVVVAYGIPLSIVLYAVYIWAFKKVSTNNVMFITLLLIFISSFLSQPWVLTPSFLVMLAYGFCINDYDKNLDCYSR